MYSLYLNGTEVPEHLKKDVQQAYGLPGDSKDGEDNEDKKDNSSNFGFTSIPETFGKAFRNLFWNETELPGGEKQMEVKNEVKAINNGPVAYIVSANFVGQFGHGPDGELGYVIIVKGPDAGKVIPIQDLGYGCGNNFSLSGAGKGSAIFYTGSPENFTLSELLGGRTELNYAKDIGKFLFIGAGGMYSDKTPSGERVIGMTLSFGVTLPVLNFKKLPSVTVNYGSTLLNK